jgi:hypothetical protein
MKRLLALVLALVMALSLCACGGSGEESSGAEDTTSGVEDFSLQELSALVGLRRLMDYWDDNLKNPSSLEILSIESVQTDDEAFALKIDYNAENSFGGKVRDTVYLTTARFSVECPLLTDDPVSRQMATSDVYAAYTGAVESGKEVVELDVDLILENIDVDEDTLTDLVMSYADI